MQLTTVILSLAATALAAPNKRSTQCTFGEYVCSTDGLSILQCDISGNLVTIGPCPDGSKCSNIGTTPYCQSTATTTEKREDTYCSAPGTYSCTADDKGIDVCNSQNQLVFNGECPDKSHCGYLNGIPFCVDDTIPGY